MSNVVSLLERKAKKIMTPEQRLKLFTLQEIMGVENTIQILEYSTVDEAFTFLANAAAEEGNMKIDPKLIEGSLY